MPSSTRPSSRYPGGLSSFVIVAGLMMLAAEAEGQDTTRIAQDSVELADTVEAADTMPPPPMLPELAFPFAERRAAGVWHWNQEALAAMAAVTVLDLIDEIPSVSTFRSGLFLQPEAASAYGGTSARVEVDLDGYVLDPLDASAIDLSTIELTSLSDVLIERRLDLLRIRLRSAATSDARPYSRVEAATGQPNANLFRGIFLAPNLLGIGPFGVSIQRLDTDGARGDPADVFDAWLKWGWQSNARGIQFEMRQSTLDRDPGSLWSETRKRRDLIVRARNRFGDAVTAEAYVGRARIDVETLEESVPDSLARVERSGVQGGVRTSVALPFGWLEASLRARDEPSLPRLQTDLGAALNLGNIMAVRADLSHQSWRETDATLSLSARADVGPILGVTPFAEWTTGERGAPLYGDYGDVELTGPLIDNRSAFRVGGEAAYPWITLGGAFVHTEVDSVPAFGLPFDRAARSYAGGSVDGYEVYGRARLYFDWLAAEGSYQRLLTGQRWAYLPVEEGRGALTMHWTPMPSGNLQLIGWLEARRRGNVSTPSPEDNGLTLVTLPAHTIYNAYLQIRIMSVRIFARWENLSGQDAQDFLGRPIRGPRLFYGVKWDFWN